MLSRGEYRGKKDVYGIVVDHRKPTEIEAILVQSGKIVSAYKSDGTDEYSYINSKAKDAVALILKGIRGCKAKNGVPETFEFGVKTEHEFTLSKVRYSIGLFNKTLVDAIIENDNVSIRIGLVKNQNEKWIPDNIPYVKLSNFDEELGEDDLDAIPVRSVEEIRMEKEDVSWYDKKKYYIVNDDEAAERIFSFLDKYDGIIAYDTETTGLKINCFGKINSSYQKTLIKYNEEHPDAKIRADRLVGIIFCVQNDISYYFPVGNRKFKNLYEGGKLREQLVERYKAKYTTGEKASMDSEWAEYWRETPAEDISNDCILMERVRNILETKHIVAHGGSYEWKVDWQYEINTNILDDTMIMHQIMYKFRGTTSNRGEPSNLKHLAKVELGVDQWELKDFFPTMVEATNKTKGTLKKKKRGSLIDFSYMDYEGTKIYAPTDGDMTFQLYCKYIKDLLGEHKEQEYIYRVEMKVLKAIAYMEFYGHRIDEDKINGARDSSLAEVRMTVSQIRQMINYASDSEVQAFNELKAAYDEYNKDDSRENRDVMLKAIDKLQGTIDDNTENQINLASPAQVSQLFYDILGYDAPEGRRSVDKKALKALTKEINTDGSPKYPVANLYTTYKQKDTLITKFFGNLTDFMYPGGLIFSSFGQISTATGRMSCKEPNAQQYPKAITKIVVPRDGYAMIDADFSQIEYRVLTALADNKDLMELFKDPDNDYHTLMASMMYEVPYASVTGNMRKSAKSFNFGIPYGMGFGSLAILLHGNKSPENVADAKEKYEMYFKNQPNTRAFFDRVKESAMIYGYTKTKWNRYRYYSFADSEGKINEGKRAAALRQAGNAVIQGSAADIFKISVARNFDFIESNGLLGKVLIINMIHDEQLLEVDVQHCNLQRILTEVGKCMMFKLDGFPPLYIGAGVGMSWGSAKGGMAEIDVRLLAEMTEESKNIPIFRTDNADGHYIDPKAEVDAIQDKVYEWRRKRVADYLTNPDNWHVTIHPAIGKLINMQFNYGRGDEASSYTGPNGEKYTDTEFLLLNIKDFIEENHLDVDYTWFDTNTDLEVEKEEDKEYSDDDDDESEDDLEDIGYDDSKEFKLIEDDKGFYGSSMYDLVNTFKVIVANGICGVDMLHVSKGAREKILDYLAEHAVEEKGEKSYQVAVIATTGVLKYLDTYVEGISCDELTMLYRGKR